ncbi:MULTISPECIES: MFS transporter [Burkholderiaceae]|uniref:MFS transporter n=2 Tax=Burkholderiales TaxID=80840 RepID=UPI001963CDD5|nr:MULTISPECIES: MFS transporter [Burkholderiaceae]
MFTGEFNRAWEYGPGPGGDMSISEESALRSDGQESNPAHVKGKIKIGNVRWAISLLWLIGVTLNYVSRNSLGVLASELQTHMHITTKEYSWVVAAFQVGYTVFQPICGWLVDAIGLKVGVALFAFIWSMACLLHAGASNWMSLAFLRFFMGATEAVALPAQPKIVGEWFPKRRRGVALGWVSMGFSVGALLAAPVIGGIGVLWGWRAAFAVPGVVGIVWALAWWRLYSPPAKSKLISPAELEYIVSDQDPITSYQRRSLWSAFKETVKQRKFYGIAIPAGLSEPGWQFLIFWVPLYFANERGMPLKQIAMFTWLPFLMSDLGSISTGYLKAFFKDRFDLTVVNSCVATALIGALLMIPMMAVPYVSSATAAIALISISGMGHMIKSLMFTNLVIEEFEPNKVATVNGFRGSVAWIGGTIFSLVMGAIVGVSGYKPILIFLGLIDLAAVAIMYWFLNDRTPAAKRA